MSMTSTTTSLFEAKELPYTTLSTEHIDEVIDYEPFHTTSTLEDVQLYNKGGHYPVHLGDRLDGRYEVVHKLGNGSFGIVWLCRDLELQKWRAVKIKTANSSIKDAEENIIDYLQQLYTPEELEEKHILLPLDRFWLDGPNGRHSCLVMPVLGWTVSNWRLAQPNHQSETYDDAKNVCLQIAEAMHFLHLNNICHGDFRPGNILMKLEGIDDLLPDQLLDIIGEPEAMTVQTVSGKPLSARAPEYCVIPPDEFWCQGFTTKSIAIIDFGESYFIKSRPKTTGVPNLYAAPEVLFQDTETLGFHSDLWSLACTIFEVWTNTPLFADLLSADVRHTIWQIESYIGPLPDKYRSKYVQMYPSIPSASISGVDYHTSQSDKETSPPPDESRSCSPDSDKSSQPSTAPTSQPEYLDKFEEVLGRERKIYRNVGPGTIPEPIRYQYPQDDALRLADLLRSMLKYDPAERISAEAVMSHTWISGGRKSTIEKASETESKLNCTAVMVSSALAVGFVGVLFFVRGFGRK